MQPEKLKKASVLKMILSRYATGKAEIKDEENYKLIRSEFIIDKSLKPLLPHFIISFRILEDFWPFIKKLKSTYEGRREYIREQFEPLLTYLETCNLLVQDNIIGYTIEKFDCDTLHVGQGTRKKELRSGWSNYSC